MLESKVYKLKYPVEWDKTEVTELTFEPLRGEHIINLNGDPKMADLISLASKVCTEGYTPKFFHKLMAPDVLAIVGVVSDFLSPSGE